MKNLIIVVLVCYCSVGAFAQNNVNIPVDVHTDYAVNISDKINNVSEKQQPAESDVANGRQDRDDQGLRRIISKTFSADRSDKVNLSNQFGSITIKVWDRREVKLDISVRANSSNEKEAQRLIDEVDIAINKTGDLISGKTDISRGSRWGKSRSREVKVDYVVYMPAANALTLSQEFGNVTMGDFSGALSAKVEYGNFVAGNLSGTNNYISVQYGKTTVAEVNKAVIRHEYGAGVVLGTVGTLDLDVEYVNVNITNVKGNALIKQEYGGGLTLGAVTNLDLDVQYATVNIGTIRGNATIKQEYNSLKIGSVGKLNIHAEYTGVSVGALKGDGNFNLSYNNLRIDEISTGCKVLTVVSEYVDMSFNFVEGYNADFIVKREYGSFKYGPNVRTKVLSDEDDDSTKRYMGRIGNGGTAGIRITAEYGSIVFK